MEIQDKYIRVFPIVKALQKDVKWKYGIKSNYVWYFIYGTFGCGALCILLNGIIGPFGFVIGGIIFIAFVIGLCIAHYQYGSHGYQRMVTNKKYPNGIRNNVPIKYRYICQVK